MVILDSDVLSGAMRLDEVVLRWLDQQPSSSIWTTTITVFEIRSGLIVMPDGRRRSALWREFDYLNTALLDGRVLPFDQAAAEEAATLMGHRQQSGQVKDARDTMIAGIALSQRATLATRNTRHFDDLAVPVVDPWSVG